MPQVLTITPDSVTDTTALTITLASLATSSGLVVGRESTAVTNVSGLYVDFQVTGQITVGTTPTINTTIEVWLYALTKHVSSTPTYPSLITGTDAGVTFPNADRKNRLLLADSMTVGTTTSDIPFAIKPFSVAELCGVTPLKWGVFVTQSTGVNLNATAGNHWLHWQGIKYTLT